MKPPKLQLRSANHGGRYAYSVSAAVVNRRSLRRGWSGHWRLLAWRVPGFDRARIHRRIAGNVVGGEARITRAISIARWRNAFSERVVDYRRGIVRGAD